jgi:hypothetical protein
MQVLIYFLERKMFSLKDVNDEVKNFFKLSENVNKEDKDGIQK